jgi:hypothetical protein
VSFNVKGHPLIAGLLLGLMHVGTVQADEWQSLRERVDNALKSSEKRIPEIENRQQAERITRERINTARGAVKGGGKGKSLADAADKAAGDARAFSDLSRDQGEYLDVVIREWGAEGGERKKQREAAATLQKNLERASASQKKAAATAVDVKASELLERTAGIEAAVTEAGDRLRARWQLQQAARERESREREREAAERARGLR